MKTASVKNTQRAEMRAATEKFRAMHHRALETLRAESCTLSGIQIWRKCVQLEKLAHAGAVALCNGEPIRVYWPTFGPRDYDFNGESQDGDWESFKTVVRDLVRNIFGHIPEGFFVNGDARGYTLKLDPDETKIPQGMHTDWGRNGILAAEINENS